MMRIQLKSKIHLAKITKADVDYEGSIEVPRDIIEATGLWEREKVLVASITTGARLETYVQPGPSGTGEIIMNGGAAHLIGAGERVTIMSFGLSDKPVEAQVVICQEDNQVIRTESLLFKTDD